MKNLINKLKLWWFNGRVFSIDDQIAVHKRRIAELELGREKYFDITNKKRLENFLFNSK